MANEKKKINLSEYKSDIGLTEKRLDFGLWFVKNRNRLFMGLIVALSLIGLITWFNTIYSFGDYYFRGAEADDAIVKEAVETRVKKSDRVDPTEVKVGAVKAIKSGDKVDFAVKIDNVNSEHWSHFSYVFVAGGFESELQEGFILPGESKYLILLSQKTNSTRSAGVRFSDVSWTRVSKHEYPDWQQFVDDRMKINVIDSEFLPAKSSGLSEKINLALLSFEVSNDSPFNYWGVNLNMLLYSRGQLVAVDKYALNEFRSGDIRDIKISMPGSIASVSRIEIIPEINLTKDDIYMKFEKSSIFDFRD